MEEEALLLGPHRSLVGIYTPADTCKLEVKNEITFIFLGPRGYLWVKSKQYWPVPCG